MAVRMYPYKNATSWHVSDYDEDTWDEFVKSADFDTYPPDTVILVNNASGMPHGKRFTQAALTLGVTFAYDISSDSVSIVVGGVPKTIRSKATLSCHTNPLDTTTATISGKLLYDASLGQYGWLADGGLPVGVPESFAVRIVYPATTTTGYSTCMFRFKTEREDMASLEMPLFFTL